MTSVLGVLTASGEAVAAATVVIEDNQDVVVSLSVGINWSGDGLTFVDEAPYCRSFSSSRGRARVNDQVTTGSCTLVLRNDSGRFSPRNAASPLYPTVVQGRAVRVSASYRGTSYAQFAGTISQIDQETHAANATVTLSVLDAFDHFRLSKATADFGAGIAPDPRVDEVLTGILAAAGWTGPTRFDTGASLAAYAQSTDNVLQALQDAAAQEIHGLLYMGKDGAVVFEAAAHRQGVPVSLVLTSVEQMTLSARQSDAIDSVHVTYNTYVWPLTDAPRTVVYSGQAGMQLAAQVSTTIAESFSAVAVRDVLVPVRGTDILANSAADDRGIDVSEAVWLETFTSSSAGFTAVIYNSLPYPVYLTRFAISGHAFAATQAPPFVELKTGTAIIPSQEMTKTLAWVTDRSLVNTWVTQYLAAFSQQRPRLTIQLVGKTPALVRFLLGVDLSTRSTLQDDGAPWLSGVVDQFYVEQITLTIAPRQILAATLTIFDQIQGVL